MPEEEGNDTELLVEKRLLILAFHQMFETHTFVSGID
jgi:hypothetical protein